MDYTIFLDFQLPNAPTWFYFSLFLAFALFFRFQRPLTLRNVDLLALFILTPGLLLLQQAKNTAGSGPADVTVAYSWLLAGTGLWLLRALADLFLERRPLLYVNLTAAGLTCLGLGLAVGLTAVALRRTTAEQTEVGRQPVPLEQVKERATEMVARTTSAHPVGGELRYLCTRLLALACHAAVISGLFFIGWRHFQDTTSGVAMATLYLLLPYTAYHIDQLHHVWPSAFVVWAVAWYRRPLWTGALLGVATGTSFFPLFLLPAWWGFYSGRGSGRFLLAYLTALLLSTAVPVSIYWLDGSYWRHFVAALHLWDWIPWRVAASEGIWTTVHWAYRLPVFVVFIALVIASAFWPHPKNLAHQIALNAAILLGLQFWHADCGGVYILWYLPLLILLVCRPNLTLAEPPLPAGSMISWLTLWTHRRTTSASTTSQELAV